MSDPKHAGQAGERLHKYLASCGAGSRRECEEYIKQGRVSVNGKTVSKMGVKVVPGQDVVLFDGERMDQERKVYYMLNKPPGYICTNSDEHGRPRAMDLVPDQRHRIYTVGRLDAESEGLILLTNDGTIANIICHPRYRVEKVYRIVVRGKMTRHHGAKLEAGVWLAEGKASPARVKRAEYDPRKDESSLEMTLFEGRNREIRRVFAKVGLKVKKLIRSRLGPLDIGTMQRGQVAILSPADLGFVYDAERLYEANKEMWDAELPPPTRHKGPRPGGSGPKGRRSTGSAPGRGPSGGGRGGGRGPARGPGRGTGRGPAREGDGKPAKRRGRRYYD